MAVCIITISVYTNLCKAQQIKCSIEPVVGFIEPVVGFIEPVVKTGVPKKHKKTTKGGYPMVAFKRSEKCLRAGKGYYIAAMHVILHFGASGCLHPGPELGAGAIANTAVAGYA